MNNKYLRGNYYCGTHKTFLETLYEDLSKSDKADNDNIVVLAYFTDKELQKRNLAINTMNMYRSNGFNYIIQHTYAIGIYRYSNEIISNLISDTYERQKRGEICFGAFKDLRRTASMLQEFRNTGKLTWQVLSPLNKRIPSGEFNDAIEAFRKYHLKYSNTVPQTTRSNCNCVSKFLCSLEDKGYTGFKDLNLKCLSYEVTEYSKNYSKSGRSHLIYYLRTFFKALGCDNECDFKTFVDFAVAVPKLAAPHKEIKQGFSSKQITIILNSIPTETSIGKRDYAMIMIGAMLGLRACDVVSIKISDIDWRNYVIKIIQSKTGEPIFLPLTSNVGNAIAEYILNGRPNSDCPYVFLPAKGPARKITSDTIGGRLRRIIQSSCTLELNQDMGFHNFRRGLGNRLLRSSIPQALISEVLGQRNINSSAPYLAADAVGLKDCGIPLSNISKGEIDL